MMANFRLIVAIVVGLSAIVLEPVEGDSLASIPRMLRDDITNDLWQEDQDNDEVAFSIRKIDIYRYGPYKEQLLKAIDQVRQEPGQCDKSSLNYVAKIGEYQRLGGWTSGLVEATEKYAQKCLKPDDIDKKIKSKINNFPLNSPNRKVVEFIDPEFITDFWSEQPKGSSLKIIEGPKVAEPIVSAIARAMAKGILRKHKNEIEDLQDEDKVDEFLNGRLYYPCSGYLGAFLTVKSQLSLAGEFLKGGYHKFISSLDDDAQNAFFRYELCRLQALNGKSRSTSIKVTSYLKSLTED